MSQVMEPKTAAVPDVKDLNDAIVLIKGCALSSEVLSGSNYAYSLLCHAERHLNGQIEAYFKEKPKCPCDWDEPWDCAIHYAIKGTL